MLKPETEETYKGDKSQIHRDTIALQELLTSRGWKLVLESIDQLIDGYRDSLEKAEEGKIKEIQYATQNLRELKKTPFALLEHISTFDVSSEAPPKEHLGFDYQK